MPLPDDGDLFFDMEGDPFYPNGLEYLFGIYYSKDDKTVFKPFWAHDHEEEKETFKRVMGFMANHLAEYPRAYIYHYNHYRNDSIDTPGLPLCGMLKSNSIIDSAIRNSSICIWWCVTVSARLNPAMLSNIPGNLLYG